ncbi:MAG TPA: aminoglycoside adenylyltransferase [Ktedonobacterales bacterium]|nr:aminoglycoside adenylyltransferase [Ktedonobacterales bacterium]
MTDESHPLGMWRPWNPSQIATLFAALSAPWWIAGGWAIDLYLGRQTRGHADIDVLFLRRDQDVVRALFAAWDMQAALPPPRDETWPFRSWRQGETLDPAIHDIWCRPSATQPWAIQLMVADTRDEQWLFRRMPTIVRPLAELGCVTPEGVPYLAPEIQLLYKAKGLRPKDEADFTRTLPALSAERRQWLRDALLTTHPQHSWLKRLTDNEEREPRG